MSYRGFLDELKNGMPAASYLLVSSDPFLLSEAVSSIRGGLSADQLDFIFHVYDLLDTPAGPVQVEQVLDVLNTVSFFQGRKYVVIENMQKMLKKDLQRLQRYLEKPSEGSVLVMLYSGSLKKEARDALGSSRQISLDISEKEVPSWLRARARSRGIDLSDGAASHLIDEIGPDLGLLSSELEKLSLIGERRIEKEDIIDIIEAKRSFNAFALVDAIRRHDADKALGIYRVLSETEEPYGILGALNWQYGKSLNAEGTDAERKNAHEVFTALNEADAAIKTSGGNYPMEHLLVRLLRLSRR